MHEMLIERWNTVITPRDRVWVLGDLLMAPANKKKELEIIQRRLEPIGRLNGEVHLIPGNHDRCHKDIYKDGASWEQVYLDAGVTKIHPPTVQIEVVDEDVTWHILMNHFPYAGEQAGDDRYEALRPDRKQAFNMPLLHGHVHGTWVQQGSMLNAGCDAHGWYPISMETVIARLRPYKTI
jgi:calcineurin-like phosphoesterase family protein